MVIHNDCGNSELKTNHRRVTKFTDNPKAPDFLAWYNYFKHHLEEPCAIVKVSQIVDGNITEQDMQNCYAVYVLGEIMVAKDYRLKGVGYIYPEKQEQLEMSDEIINQCKQFSKKADLINNLI